MSSPRYAGTIHGRPVPFARTRGQGQTGRYNPERYRQWKEAAGFVALGIRQGQPPLVGPLGAELVVTPDGIAFEVFELPLLTGSRAGLRGDLDNYVKATLDGIQKVLFADDRQIETITAHFATDLEEPPNDN